MNKTTEQGIRNEINKLESGEFAFVPESDYGKAEIWLINDVLVLFEIPMYGGTPMYNSVYPNTESGINQVINKINSWT